MKTFAQLNKYIGKADARLISAREGLQAVRNPNESVAIKMGEKSIVKFGTNKEVTLNTHGQLTPKWLRILNTYSPFEIELVYGQWFIYSKDGYMSRLPNKKERQAGWRYTDGITFGPDGQVEVPYRNRLDVYEVADERQKVQNYAQEFVRAMTRASHPGITFMEYCRCPFCAIIVNKKITLGEMDPTHLRKHLDYLEFNAPLICRAVEKSSPRHHDEAVVALNKFMTKKAAIRLSAAEKKLLSGILKNYLLLELKHPITTNGI